LFGFTNPCIRAKKTDMKKLYVLLLSMLAVTTGFGQLITEPFNYAASTNHLPTASGGAWTNVNSGDNIITIAGSLSYPGFSPSTGNRISFDGAGADAYKSFTSQTTGTTYYSFLLNVTALGSLNTTGGYFAAFSEGTTSTNIGACVWSRLSGAGYNVGISTRSTTAVSWLSPTLSLNTTYLVVVAYTFNPAAGDNTASIWLNPVTLGGTAPPADATGVAGTDLANAGRMQIRQDATAATPFIEMDELRVGLDYASVTPVDPAFTTPTLNVSSLPSFGSLCINTTGGPNSFNIGGSNLTAEDVTIGPLAGYTFSTTSGGAYTSSLTVSHAAGSFFQTVFVKFTPTAVQSYNGSVPVTGGGATASSTSAVGSGISAPVVVTGASSAITVSGATVAGTISNIGCSAVTAYGIEYSTTTGFTPGTGTQVAGSNLAGSAFSVPLTGLNPGVTYYAVAYATNGSGTGYGAQISFTTAVPPAPTQAPVATAATAITSSSFNANWNSVSDATNYRLDVFTQSTATVSNTDIASWTMKNQYIPKYADTGTVNNVVNIDSVVTVGTAAITNANGPYGPGNLPNPYALQATGWDAGQDAKYWEIQVNTTGASNLTISSLQGSSNTGPRDFKIQYKVGAGGTYTDIAGAVSVMPANVQAGTIATWAAINNIAIPAAAENQPVVYFRWIMTSNIAVNGAAVAVGGTSRLSGIYIKGNYTGIVRTYVPGYQNLSTGNVLTYNVTGLAASTTYMYVVRAENAGGYSQNSNTISVTTLAGAAATLSATAPSGFGNVCINTTAPDPVNFTITGTALSTADVVVGPLTGYTFSTTAGGVYTNSLTLTQPGGSYSQQVFVKFTPTAVQSYNGNIPVSGGGATAINVAASGAGINTAATVQTGAASNITSTTATLNGTISANGCSAITAYGFIWSTTNGFDPSVSGTNVAASNLSGGIFSANVNLFNPATTYYYVAYATNGGGTVYGTQQSFTTLAQPTLSGSALTAFGPVCINTVAGPNSFTITGSNLNSGNIFVTSLNGYSYSTTSGGVYTSSLTLSQPGGNYSQQIFVKFSPTAVQGYNGPITVSGGGASVAFISASGSGINTAPSVTTGAATGVSTSGATLPGTITATGCSAITAYGFVWSTTNGFDPATTGTNVAASNLAAGAFSTTLSSLGANTTYYYVAYATNGGGTTYGTQQSFTTSSTPSLSAGALTAFGNQCINTTSAANSFTITGSNLTNANVTVGPLTGFSFSTTSGGSYVASLPIIQPGGSFSQQVFVQFTPNAVQSFNGNIPVSGGGASAINVAATGSGINTAATVTAGAASGITSSAATVPGNISSNGCSSVTAYGAIYSTTNGFNPATTGTTVAASNLAAGNFSASIGGLAPATIYYYVTFATNAGGTSYSTQGSFTTTAAPALSTGTIAAFGSVCINTTSSANSFTVTGSNLTGDVTVGALAGYAYSATSGGTYTSTLTLTPTSGALNTTVFVKLTPTAVQSYSGNIQLSGGGASAVNVAVTGAGINTMAGVNTDAPTAITNTSATGNGEIFTPGCSAVTAYGVVYSTTNGFNPATAGTIQAGSNLSSGIFSVNMTGLTPGTVYYYVAYATNAGGTSYGTQQTFTTTAGAAPVAPVATAGTAITSSGFTANWNAVAGATGYFLDVYTLSSGGTTIAGWDMATNASVAAASTANLGIVGNINTAQLTTNSGGTLSTPAGFSGTSGTPNPYAVSSNGWNTGSGTKYWQVDVVTTGQTGLTVTSNQGSSSTGPKDWKLQYRVGNTGAFTDVTGGVVTLTTAVVAGTPNTWGTLTAVALPAAAENQPLVQLRWIMTSDLAINGAAVASTGTSRISGIYVKAAGGSPTPVYVTGYQNLSVGNVTSFNVTGLSASTTYYYVVRANNASGTSPNSNEITVLTTANVSPTLSANTLTAFANTCINTTTAANNFTITGSNLTTANVTVGPLAGFAFSTTSGGIYTPSLSLTQPGGAFSQQVFVQFTPTAVQSYSGNIPVGGGGATTAINVAANGAGVNTAPTVTAGAATGVSGTAATIPGTITVTGCSAVTAYGTIWSTTNGFNPATTGTNVAGSNLAAGSFSVALSGLTTATTYYYVTYATNGGGTSYSAQQSFITSSGGTPPAAPVATAATGISTTGFTANWNAVAGATGYFLDVYTLGAGSGTTTVAGWDMATNASVAAASTANLGIVGNINTAQLTTNSGGTLSTPAGFSCSRHSEHMGHADSCGTSCSGRKPATGAASLDHDFRPCN
jgi:hypothetical protein